MKMIFKLDLFMTTAGYKMVTVKFLFLLSYLFILFIYNNLRR